jgi:hypothetical protein
MNDELKYTLVKFENKLASLWQLDGQLNECDDADRAWSLEKRMKRVQFEADEARAELFAKIEAYCHD